MRVSDVRAYLLSKATTDEATGCWNWTGRPDRYGYSRVGINGIDQGAYRLAYTVMIGPVPAGLVLDHLCRNRLCINPAHLEAITNRENILRGASWSARNAAKTHCVHGHEFTPENTRRPRNGQRQCRECRRSWLREYKRRQRELARAALAQVAS